MTFDNYDTISPEVREQTEKVSKIWKSRLGDRLIGVYLHGSLALGCFTESTSDLDILIVTNGGLSRAERLAIIRDLFEIDHKPCPLEMSAVALSALNPWHHPTACCFHYSDYHADSYKKLLSGELTDYYIIDHDFEDSDIACHVKLTKQCGIVVTGRPIAEVFPDVPERDFVDSIANEIDDYDFSAYQPRYFSSNILILGRILSYFKLGKIVSKYDGGVWAANYVPEKYRGIIENALGVWYEGKEPEEWDEKALEGLRAFLVDEIKKEMA